MAEQTRVNQPIDWSNPDDPKTKEAAKDFLFALAKEELIETEIREILIALYLTTEKEDQKLFEEMLEKADQEIKKFWETLRPDASVAMKNKDKDALSQCLNVVAGKITDLQTQNGALSATINQHKDEIAIVTKEWKARQAETNENIVKKLANKLPDKKGGFVGAVALTVALKQAAPADIDKSLGQKDLHAKIESLLQDLGPDIDRKVLFEQMAKGRAHLTQLRICAELYREGGEMPTGPKLLEAVKKLKELGQVMAEMQGDTEKDANDMQAVHSAYKNIFVCQKKVDANQNKIAVLEGAQKNLQSSLNVLENKNAGHEHAAKASNIPDAPPPPPVMRRK